VCVWSEETFEEVEAPCGLTESSKHKAGTLDVNWFGAESKTDWADR
jgi:hypothetical protein